MLLTVPNTFANGTGEANKIDAVQMNANFTAVATVLNGNIEKNNVKTGSAICLNDTAMSISAVWSFSSFPTVPDASVPDAKLSANIPLKNAANVFSAQQKFSAGIDGDKQEAKNFVVELVTSNPTWTSADKGRIIFNITEGKGYIGGNSAWKQIDYVGDYTGGAVRPYSNMGIVDDADGYKFYFKTEGSTPTVKIVLKGEPFPQRFYLELPYHTHVFTGVNHSHSITDSGHTHTTNIGSHTHGTAQYALSTHTHSISGASTSADSPAHYHDLNNHYHSIGGTNHKHTGVTTGGGDTDYEDGANSQTGAVNGYTGFPELQHTHTLTCTTGTSSASQQIPSENIGNKTSASSTTGISIQNTQAGGSNAYAGVNIGSSLSTSQKLYAKSLTVKIDGTNVTSDILSSTGWSAIGDGSGSHAFHTTGSGEMDASSWVTYSPGLHVLEILEPESGYGSSVLIHIETT